MWTGSQVARVYPGGSAAGAPPPGVGEFGSPNLVFRILPAPEPVNPTCPLETGPARLLSPQLTAFFTSAAILASSAAVNSLSAKAVGHMAPSSRFALSLKPNVAYLVLNFCALWKKQMTLPSLAYAGIPYQVVAERAGALALMRAWSRSAMARSGCDISAIFASTSLSPSALFALAPRRAAALSSWARSLIAARSSSANPLGASPVVLLVGFCVPFAPASLPGDFFSDISASYPVAFSRKTTPLSRRLTRDEPYSWGGRDRVAGL